MASAPTGADWGVDTADYAGYYGESFAGGGGYGPDVGGDDADAAGAQQWTTAVDAHAVAEATPSGLGESWEAQHHPDHSAPAQSAGYDERVDLGDGDGGDTSDSSERGSRISERDGDARPGPPSDSSDGRSVSSAESNDDRRHPAPGGLERMASSFVHRLKVAKMDMDESKRKAEQHRDRFKITLQESARKLHALLPEEERRARLKRAVSERAIAAAVAAKETYMKLQEQRNPPPPVVVEAPDLLRSMLRPPQAPTSDSIASTDPDLIDDARSAGEPRGDDAHETVDKSQPSPAAAARDHEAEEEEAGVSEPAPVGNKQTGGDSADVAEPVSLEIPAGPDRDWVPVLDEGSGYVYYFNTATQESRWDLPVAAVQAVQAFQHAGGSATRQAQEAVDGSEAVALDSEVKGANTAGTHEGAVPDSSDHTGVAVLEPVEGEPMSRTEADRSAVASGVTRDVDALSGTRSRSYRASSGSQATYTDESEAESAADSRARGEHDEDRPVRLSPKKPSFWQRMRSLGRADTAHAHLRDQVARATDTQSSAPPDLTDLTNAGASPSVVSASGDSTLRRSETSQSSASPVAALRRQVRGAAAEAKNAMAAASEVEGTRVDDDSAVERAKATRPVRPPRRLPSLFGGGNVGGLPVEGTARDEETKTSSVAVRFGIEPGDEAVSSAHDAERHSGGEADVESGTNDDPTGRLQSELKMDRSAAGDTLVMKGRRQKRSRRRRKRKRKKRHRTRVTIPETAGHSRITIGGGASFFDTDEQGLSAVDVYGVEAVQTAGGASYSGAAGWADYAAYGYTGGVGYAETAPYAYAYGHTATDASETGYDAYTGYGDGVAGDGSDRWFFQGGAAYVEPGLTQGEPAAAGAASYGFGGGAYDLSGGASAAEESAEADNTLSGAEARKQYFDEMLQQWYNWDMSAAAREAAAAQQAEEAAAAQVALDELLQPTTDSGSEHETDPDARLRSSSSDDSPEYSCSSTDSEVDSKKVLKAKRKRRRRRLEKHKKYLREQKIRRAKNKRKARAAARKAALDRGGEYFNEMDSDDGRGYHVFKYMRRRRQKFTVAKMRKHFRRRRARREAKMDEVALREAKRTRRDRRLRAAEAAGLTPQELDKLPSDFDSDVSESVDVNLPLSWQLPRQYRRNGRIPVPWLSDDIVEGDLIDLVTQRIERHENTIARKERQQYACLANCAIICRGGCCMLLCVAAISVAVAAALAAWAPQPVGPVARDVVNTVVSGVNATAYRTEDGVRQAVASVAEWDTFALVAASAAAATLVYCCCMALYSRGRAQAIARSNTLARKKPHQPVAPDGYLEYDPFTAEPDDGSDHATAPSSSSTIAADPRMLTWELRRHVKGAVEMSRLQLGYKDVEGVDIKKALEAQRKAGLVGLGALADTAPRAKRRRRKKIKTAEPPPPRGWRGTLLRARRATVRLRAAVSVKGWMAKRRRRVHRDHSTPQVARTAKLQRSASGRSVSFRESRPATKGDVAISSMGMTQRSASQRRLHATQRQQAAAERARRETEREAKRLEQSGDSLNQEEKVASKRGLAGVLSSMRRTTSTRAVRAAAATVAREDAVVVNAEDSYIDGGGPLRVGKHFAKDRSIYEKRILKKFIKPPPAPKDLRTVPFDGLDPEERELRGLPPIRKRRRWLAGPTIKALVHFTNAHGPQRAVRRKAGQKPGSALPPVDIDPFHKGDVWEVQRHAIEHNLALMAHSEQQKLRPQDMRIRNLRSATSHAGLRHRFGRDGRIAVEEEQISIQAKKRAGVPRLVRPHSARLHGRTVPTYMREESARHKYKARQGAPQLVPRENLKALKQAKEARLAGLIDEPLPMSTTRTLTGRSHAPHARASVIAGQLQTSVAVTVPETGSDDRSTASEDPDDDDDGDVDMPSEATPEGDEAV